MNLDEAISTIFPVIEFTTTELNEIAKAFSHPSVKKYLRRASFNSIQSISMDGIPAEGESAESYLRRQAAVAGGLAVYSALLQIEAPSDANL